MPGLGKRNLPIDGTGFIPGVTQVSASLSSGAFSASLTTTATGSTSLLATLPAEATQQGGYLTLTFVNPGAAPVLSTIAIDNPTPLVTGLSPMFAPAEGTVYFTIQGKNFLPGITVTWTDATGAPRPLSIVSTSATAILASVPLDGAPAGPARVQVDNPGPGGGPSNPAAFNVALPTPTVAAVTDPGTTLAGGPDFTLNIDGANFLAGATVLMGDRPLATTYMSANVLTVAISGASLTTPGTISFSVENPDGQSSGTSALTVNAAQGSLTSLSPAGATTGSGPLSVKVNGLYFLPASVVLWNGLPRPTTFVSGHELDVTLSAADLAQPGVGLVQVSYQGGLSASRQTFPVLYPPPGIDSMYPQSIPALSISGSALLPLTINGTNFQSSDVVEVSFPQNSALFVPQQTTFFSGTGLQGFVRGSDLVAAGTLQVRVRHTAGGGNSASVPLVVIPPDAGGDVEFSGYSYDVTESKGSVTITVLRSGPSTRAVSVSYATSDGSALAGTDYTATIGTLSFSAGQTSKTFTVPIKNDKIYENDEYFFLALNAATGGAGLGFPTQTAVLIHNSTLPPVVQLKQSSDSGPPTQTPSLTVTLSAASALPTVVNYAVTGGNTVAGTDYTLPDVPTLTINPGQTSALIPLILINDGQVHPNRTLQITLSSPANATLGNNISETFTILPLPTISFQKASGSGTEPASASLPVILSAKASFPATVNYAITGGTAVAGTDYKLTPPGTLTIRAGKTSQNLVIPVLDDKLYGTNKTIQVTLSSPSNALLGSTAIFTYTIVEKQKPPTVAFQKASDSGPITQNANLVVVLSNASALTTTVNFAITGGTAVAGKDYLVPAVTTVTFNPGQTMATIPITILNDGTKHPDRTLQLTLSGPVNATLGKIVVETFKITDTNK